MTPAIQNSNHAGEAGPFFRAIVCIPRDEVVVALACPWCYQAGDRLDDTACFVDASTKRATCFDCTEEYLKSMVERDGVLFMLGAVMQPLLARFRELKAAPYAWLNQTMSQHENFVKDTMQQFQSDVAKMNSKKL